MSALRFAAPGRQPALLALVAAAHAGVLAVVAAGLLPRLLEALPQPRIQFVVVPPPEPVARERPALTAPGAYAPERAPMPVVVIPLAEDDSVRLEPGPGPRPEVAGPPQPAEAAAFSPPTLRIRDERLAALIDACYPATARRRGEQGRAHARVVVGPGGRVAQWTLMQGTGSPRLDAALDCVVRRLPFDPARRDGVAVSAEVRLPIAFRMN